MAQTRTQLQESPEFLEFIKPLGLRGDVIDPAFKQLSGDITTLAGRGDDLGTRQLATQFTVPLALFDLSKRLGLSREQLQEGLSPIVAEMGGAADQRQFTLDGVEGLSSGQLGNPDTFNILSQGLEPGIQGFFQKQKNLEELQRLQEVEQAQLAESNPEIAALLEATDFPADPNEDPDAIRQRLLAQRQRAQILGFIPGFEQRGDEFRQQLVDLLSEGRTRQKEDIKAETEATREILRDELSRGATQAFERQNPFILEDLNRRGLFTSPEAVTESQAEFIRDLESENLSRLAGFDIGASQRREQDIRGGEAERLQRLSALDSQLFGGAEQFRSDALSSLLSGEQASVDFAIASRQRQQERAFQRAIEAERFARERDFAESAARRQSRDQLISSLIGLGGTIGGGLLGSFAGPAGIAIGSQLGGQLAGSAGGGGGTAGVGGVMRR